jgi:beta-phosphoglucomutase
MEQILTWGGVYLTEAEKLHWADVKNNWYLSLLTQMKPDEVLDGVLPTLRKLRKMGIKIGLSSGSRNAARVVSCLQLVAFFDAVVDGSAYRKNKPDPACYLVTAANLGVPPQQTLVFEDMPAGIIAALTGGFRVIGVGQREHLSLAHHVISDFINFQPEEYGILPQPINANA